MAVRVKRRRRLIIVLVVTVSVLAVVGGGFLYRLQKIRSDALDARVVGMESYNEEDYFKAMHQLGRYLNHYPDDLDAMYKYAHARLNIPEDGGKHISQSIGMLRRLVELDPTYPKARTDLLDLYLASGLRAEVKSLAEDILELEPDHEKATQAKFRSMIGLSEFEQAMQYADEILKTDPSGEYVKAEVLRKHALTTKVYVLNKEGKYEQALEYSKQYNELAPEDIENQFVTLQLMYQLGTSPDQCLARVHEIKDRQGDDYRYLLLEAMAYRLASDRENATRLLREVVKSSPDDELLLKRLINELDLLGLYDEATAALSAASKQVKSLWLQRVFVHRLVQAGLQEQALEYFNQVKIDPNLPDADSELLGMHAMILLEAQQHPEAGQIIEVLSKRTHNRIAEAWVPFLRDVKAQENPEVTDVIEICQKSISSAPNNPYYHYLLGQAYASLDEIELAMNAWGKAAEYGPTWAAPRMKIAKAMLSTDRKVMAVPIAESAFRRAPRHPEVAMTLAMAVASNMDQLPDDRLGVLMSMIESIQAVLPNDLRARQIEILIMARRGERDAARIKFMEILESEDVELSESMLHQLSDLSRRVGLGLENLCMVQAKKKYGVTPVLALQNALGFLRKGKPEEGLQLLQKAMEDAGQADNPNWNLSLAKYLDASGEDDSLEIWKQLGDENQENVGIQKDILSSGVAWTDLDFIDQTISRLRTHTRDEAIAWRIARSRWIMNKSNGDEQELSKAAEMLQQVVAEAPAIVDPRLVLAYCYQRLNNLTGAVEQLTRASEIQPSNHNIKLDLARVLQSQNNYDRVRVVLKQVIQSENITANHVRQAAQLFVRQGDVDQGLTLLEQIYDPEAKPQDADLLLARIYVQKNKEKEAELIIQRSLAYPTAAAIRYAADYYASRGQSDEAENALGLLADIPMAPGVSSIIRGEYYAKHSDVKRAVQEYEQAVKSAPKNPSIWRELIRLHIFQHNTEQVISVGKRAIDALGEDDKIHWFMQRADLVQQSIEDKQPVGLINGLFGNNETRMAAEQCLNLLGDAKKDPSTQDQILNQLMRLADTNTQFYELQIYLTKLMTSRGRYEDAVKLGTRAMEAFPTNPVPAKLSTAALAAAGRWDEVAGVAMLWRERAGRQTVNADMMIAEAKLRLNDPHGALRQISPYVQDQQEPTTHSPIHVIYAKSLLLTGQVAEAEIFLTPLLTDPLWRETWIRLAVTSVLDPNVAQDWLDRIPGMLSLEEHKQWLLLIRGWIAIAEKYNRPEYYEKAKALSNEVVKHSNTPSELFLMNGIVEYELGHLEAAIISYRKSIETNPKMHSAKNNLAMALAEQGVSLDEALELAKQSVATAPNVAAYFDTLATVYTARDEYELAIKNMEQAIEIEPGNPIWRDNLDAIKAKAGEQEVGQPANVSP